MTMFRYLAQLFLRFKDEVLVLVLAAVTTTTVCFWRAIKRTMQQRASHRQYEEHGLAGHYGS